MKKLKFLVTAVAVLVFGAVSCSDSSDDSEKKEPSKVAIANLKASPTSVTVAVEQTKKVAITVEPSDVTGLNIDAVSSAGTKASAVYANGEVSITGVAITESDPVTITVTATDDSGTSKSVEITVTVKNETPINALNVAEGQENQTVKIGFTYDNDTAADKLITVDPSETTDDWEFVSVTGDDVVKAEGKTLTALKDGTATVKAKVVGKEVESAVITIEVEKEEASIITSVKYGNPDTTNADPQNQVEIEKNASGEYVYEAFTGAEEWSGWQNQVFFYTNASIEAGKNYLLSFDASSTGDVSAFNTIKDNGAALFEKKSFGTISETKTTIFIPFEGKDIENVVFMFAFVTHTEGASVTTSNWKLEELDVSTLTVRDLDITITPSTVVKNSEIEVSVAMIDDTYGSSWSVATATIEVKKGETVITPTNGKYKLEEDGDYTIKADYEGATKTITITVSAEKDYATLFKKDLQTSENDISSYDYMALWYVADASWNCGAVVTISDVSVSADGKTYTVTRDTAGSNNWSTQIFYKAKAACTIAFNIKSTEAGKITINDEAKNLEANVDLPVSIPVTEASTFGNGGKTALKILLGNDQNILPAGTLTISDFTVTYN